jgi:hypothetical protein
MSVDGQDPRIGNDWDREQGIGRRNVMSTLCGQAGAALESA